MLSISIVSHGHESYFDELTRTLTSFISVPFQVVVIDNIGNGEFFRKTLDKHGVADSLVLSNDVPRNFSKNYNEAVRRCRYESVLILNPDTRLFDRSVERFVLERRDIPPGLFFPSLVGFDGQPQIHGKSMPSLLRQLMVVYRLIRGSPPGGTQQGHDWYFAAAILVNRNFFLEIGGFCELFPLYCEDVEICDRVRQLGHPVELLGHTTLMHALGNEAKGRHLGKALASNLLLRFVIVRNHLFYGRLRMRPRSLATRLDH